MSDNVHYFRWPPNANSSLVLITIEHYRRLPIGTQLLDTEENLHRKGEGVLSEEPDRRGGYVLYGFPDKPEYPAKVEFLAPYRTTLCRPYGRVTKNRGRTRLLQLVELKLTYIPPYDTAMFKGFAISS